MSSITISIGLLAVGLAGFATQRGNICTVAAIEQVVQERRVALFASLLEASLWVTAGFLALNATNLLPSVPHGYQAGALTIVGGTLFGFGAVVNGACAFGSAARLGSGDLAYLATPAGFFAAVSGMRRWQSSPHLDYLTQAAALALLAQLSERITGAGWKVDHDERPVPTGPELRLGLRDPALPDDTWWFAAIYSSGDARLFVKLRRTHRAGPNGPDDLFLVTLQWRDDVLLDRAIALAKQLRREDGLAPALDRPIVLDTYVARVRELMPKAF